MDAATPRPIRLEAKFAVEAEREAEAEAAEREAEEGETERKREVDTKRGQRTGQARVAGVTKVGIGPATVGNCLDAAGRGTEGWVSILGAEEIGLVRFKREKGGNVLITGKQLLQNFGGGEPVAMSLASDGGLLAVATKVELLIYGQAKQDLATGFMELETKFPSHISPTGLSTWAAPSSPSSTYLIALAGRDGAELYLYDRSEGKPTYQKLVHLHMGFPICRVSLATPPSTDEVLLFCGSMGLRASVWRFPLSELLSNQKKQKGVRPKPEILVVGNLVDRNSLLTEARWSSAAIPNDNTRSTMPRLMLRYFDGSIEIVSQENDQILGKEEEKEFRWVREDVDLTLLAKESHNVGKGVPGFKFGIGGQASIGVWSPNGRFLAVSNDKGVCVLNSKLKSRVLFTKEYDRKIRGIACLASLKKLIIYDRGLCLHLETLPEEAFL